MVGYAAGGLVSTVLVLGPVFAHTKSKLLAGLACISVAGILPVIAYWREVRAGLRTASASDVLVCCLVGGIWSIFLGTLIQGLLLMFGVHNILGLPIDHWCWKFPYSSDAF